MTRSFPPLEAPPEMSMPEQRKLERRAHLMGEIAADPSRGVRFQPRPVRFALGATVIALIFATLLAINPFAPGGGEGDPVLGRALANLDGSEQIVHYRQELLLTAALDPDRTRRKPTTVEVWRYGNRFVELQSFPGRPDQLQAARFYDGEKLTGYFYTRDRKAVVTEQQLPFAQALERPVNGPAAKVHDFLEDPYYESKGFESSVLSKRSAVVDGRPVVEFTLKRHADPDTLEQKNPGDVEDTIITRLFVDARTDFPIEFRERSYTSSSNFETGRDELNSIATTLERFSGFREFPPTPSNLRVFGSPFKMDSKRCTDNGTRVTCQAKRLSFDEARPSDQAAGG